MWERWGICQLTIPPPFTSQSITFFLFCDVKFVINFIQNYIYIHLLLDQGNKASLIVACKYTILKKSININRTVFVVKFQNVAIENAINYVWRTRLSRESSVLMKEVLSTIFSTIDLLISTSNLIVSSHLPIFSRIILTLSKQKRLGIQKEESWIFLSITKRFRNPFTHMQI